MKRHDNFRVLKGERKMSVIIADELNRSKLLDTLKMFKSTKKEKKDDSAKELFDLAWEFRRELDITEEDVRISCKELRKEIDTCL